MLMFQETNSVGNYNYNSHIYDKCEWDYHFHKNYELIYVIEGRLEVIADGREYVMNKNEFSLLLPNCIHHLHTPETAKVWIGVFSADYVIGFDNFVKDRKNRNTTFFVDGILMPYLKKVLISSAQPDLLTLCSALYAVCATYVQSGDFYFENTENDLPIKIFKYVENNFRENISLKTTAAELGYDYHYISRVYHSIFHINFKRFLNRFRLDYAQNLILRTAESITDIAYESGFGSVRTMNRSFAEEYGISPSDMRKNSVMPKTKGVDVFNAEC